MALETLGDFEVFLGFLFNGSYYFCNRVLGGFSMIIESTGQWCTTLHNCSRFVELLAERLGCGWQKQRGFGWYLIDNKSLFVGNVPKTSGRDRPDARLVFLVVFGDRRLLVSGEDLGVVVSQLVDELFN